MRRGFGLVAAVVAGVVLVAGCGSDDGADEADDPTSSASGSSDGATTLAAACPQVEEALPARELPRRADWTDASVAIDELVTSGDDDTQAALEKLQGTLQAYITYPDMSNGEFKALSRAYTEELDELSTVCSDAGAPIFA